MGYEAVKTIELGDSVQLDPNAKLIRVEQGNNKLFNRVYGDIANPECVLVVPPTHYCVLLKNGAPQDIRSGGEYPLFTNLKKKFFGGYKKPAPIAIDVIFMSKTLHAVIKWGTSEPMRVRDTYTNVPCNLRAFGEFEFMMKDPMQFYLTIVGSDKSYSMADLKARITSKVMLHLENAMKKTINAKGLTYDRLDEERLYISESVVPSLAPILDKDFGIELIGVIVSSMTIDNADIERIEAARLVKDQEIRERRDAKELALELERLDDKKWEREVFLRELERVDKDKFHEVLKIFNEHHIPGTRQSGAGVPTAADKLPEDDACPECGAPRDPSSKFCKVCGTRYPVAKEAPKAAAGGSVKCPNCGADIPAKSKFCPECGQPAPKAGPRFCSECGTKVEDPNTKFCPECGHKL